LCAVDIGNAYLEADMTGEDALMILNKFTAGLLVKIDPKAAPFIDARGELVVRLKKALYGCLQSAKAWFDHLTTILLDLGYTQNPYVECVCNREAGSSQVTIAGYVDDLLVTSVAIRSQAVD
jgi:hypothetical protein